MCTFNEEYDEFGFEVSGTGCNGNMECKARMPKTLTHYFTLFLSGETHR